MSKSFFDTGLYSPWEIFWYAGGFLAWTPAYVAIIWRAVKHHQLEMPVVAAIGNITWELLWGFFYRVDMGWGLQVIYMGAFILDLGIFVAVLLYGAAQVRTADVRRYWPLLVGMVTVGWTVFYAALKRQGYDLPLGSVSAYLDNIEMSALYLWAGITFANPFLLSKVVAWSKFVGTAMVTVFVFLAYPDHTFVRTLAVMVGVMDIAYVAVLTRRHRREGVPTPAPEPALVTAVA